jgi:citrate lyase subunit beta / citryl-CoA lyase
MTGQHLQTVLYIAGDREPDRASLEHVAPDAIIIDLEESVASTNKAAARAGLGRLVASLAGVAKIIVRINGFGATGIMESVSDLLACCTLPHDVAILVPKPITPAFMQSIVLLDARRELWCMGEEAGFAEILPELVGVAPQLSHVVIGTKDLCESIGISHDSKSVALAIAVSAIAKATKQSGLKVIEGVTFGDAQVVSAAARSAKARQFDGITLVRPRDVTTVKEATDQ